MARHFMTVAGRGGKQWQEEVPLKLNNKDAPNILGLDPIQRALRTVQYFNDTLRPGEEVREVVDVKTASGEVLYTAPEKEDV